jgi:hypothetical protein
MTLSKAYCPARAPQEAQTTSRNVRPAGPLAINSFGQTSHTIATEIT